MKVRNVFVSVAVAVLGMVIALAGCSTPGIEPAPTFVPPATAVPVPGATCSVGRGDITATLHMRGWIEAKRSTSLAFPMDGMLDMVYVAPGDEVVEGDLLAEIAADELERLVEERAFELELAELALAQIEAEASAALAAASAKIAQENAEYDQTVLDGEIAIVQVKRDAADGNCGDWCNVLLAQTESRAANANRIAQAQLDAMRASYNSIDSSYDLEMAVAEVKLERTRTLHLRATEQLSKTLLTAPFSGQIVSVDKRPGDPIEAYAPFGTLADPRELLVIAMVPEEDLNQVTDGQPAQIQLDAPSRQTYDAMVYDIASEATLWQGKMVYEVTLTLLEGQSIAGSPRMGVSVSIVRGSVEDVLLIPNEVIVGFAGQSFVQVVKANDELEQVTVQTGLTDGVYTEIISGLEEGQKLRVP